ncbi:D-stereospecific aminopeptidase [Rhodobacter viridis]|uniref:D-stereospecific aminopeptidase n=1 Tax=Rhodobacter viridis TaxID=1054202 RepID=A0A318U6L5_9RHOB|nr:D-aminopeptidase [Rhodobacter viridis]PYF10226.1 D-stereospecific aminopeptidase [Rhodobacter viridis]
MTQIDLSALETALDALPKRHPGPGGVAGVLKDGVVIATRAWGYADLDTAQPMTARTRLPICSISKQFTCQVLLAEVEDLARLDAKVAAFLPKFTGPLPTVRQLCDNQSGLRDYWALTVLQGAKAEQTFTRGDALPLIARMKTGHFPPGTAYSYCNCNYRIVSELIEAETGAALPDLYRKHIWGPAGMTTAVLTADTRAPEDGVIGYEGSDATGFFPADNGIYWIGDAGISASLDDMLAYERWIDATREDETSLYRRISAQPHFSDGTPAAYGFGLAQHDIAGQRFTGHAGALRGFRAQRLNARDARLSVVVIFNHEGDTFGAAQSLIEAALGHKTPAPAPLPEGWDGQWLADDGLIVQIESGRRSASLRYATGGETVTLAADGTLCGSGVVLARTAEGLRMTRSKDNTAPALVALPALDSADAAEIAGRYSSAELEADLVIEARDGAAFARFEGMLGAGRMERMAPAGRDVWTVATRRSMDAPAPGDWTLVVTRDATGAVHGLTLGCWLARGVVYSRAS